MDKLTPQDLNRILSVGGSAVGAKSKHQGWTIDALELGKAVELFELELTVMVRFSHGLATYGTHHVKSKYTPNGLAYWHHITISNRISLDQANYTLWHELTHASQVEQWAKQTNHKFTDFYSLAYKNGVRYENKFWEQHANKIADQMIAEGRRIIK